MKFLEKQNLIDTDWILTLSQGGSFRPHHALLKMPELHRKWIAYIHDPYPMHWYPPPYTWKEAGYQMKQQFMEEVADKCQYAAFPSLYLKEWMGSHYKAYAEKGVVIPHQLSEYIERKKPDFINLDNSFFNILHAGNFLQARQPEGLIIGFKKFMEKHPGAKARLIHVGPAPHYIQFLEEEAKGFDQIQVFCENKPFEEVAWLQEKASVNIIIEAKAEFSPFLPGKFPHCIASRKPILLLGPPKSESRRLLGESYSFYSEIDNAEYIAELLESLYLKWEKGTLIMDYSEIEKYLSSEYLKKVVESL